MFKKMIERNILCTICARGGSKGVKNKNIRLLAGKPLIAYTIQQALATKIFDHVVVSTDSDDIAQISLESGAEVFFKRSPELSSDTSGKLEVVKDAFMRSEQHFQKEFDVLVDLDATSPLRDVSDIVNAYELLQKDDHSNVITAMPSRRSPYFNLVEQDSTGGVSLSKPLDKAVVRRQDAPKTYDMNASIYVWKREAILNETSLFLEKTGLYVMPEERSIDIDSPLDFKYVEFLVKERNCASE
jgi:CMP-N,N'-diacetyllegionaminic acid synthase